MGGGRWHPQGLVGLSPVLGRRGHCEDGHGPLGDDLVLRGRWGKKVGPLRVTWSWAEGEGRRQAGMGWMRVPEADTSAGYHEDGRKGCRSGLQLMGGRPSKAQELGWTLG